MMREAVRSGHGHDLRWHCIGCGTGLAYTSHARPGLFVREELHRLPDRDGVVVYGLDTARRTPRRQSADHRAYIEVERAATIIIYCPNRGTCGMGQMLSM